MMEAVTEAVQAYAQIYADQVDGPGSLEVQPVGLTAPEVEDDSQDISYDVNEVLFSFMSERDKLSELSKLLGKLRFAVEGNDSPSADEAAAEISMLARHLPEEFWVLALLTVAKDTSQKGSRLAQLYLDRCFRLSDGDASSVRDLEQQIQSLETQE